MSRALSPEEIDTAVQALPGWSATADGLRREVAVSDQDKETLVDAISAVAEEEPAKPRVESNDTGLHIVLATASGGVTANEVELAGRLDRLLSGGTAWDKY